MSRPSTPIEIDSLRANRRPKYSICTLVTKPDEYKLMVSSFKRMGFDGEYCEFIYSDNSNGNKYDGFRGINTFLSYANGEYIIICHQDVELLSDGRDVLDQRIDELNSIDPHWGVVGNAGCNEDGKHLIRISDPHGTDLKRGPFPSPVTALDENFIIVRRASNLGVLPHLSGFHLYATDLCITADNFGMRNYIIDFHLYHKSSGYRDKSYYDIERGIIYFRSRSMRPKLVSSCGKKLAIFISGNRLLNNISNRLLRSKLYRLVFWMQKLFRNKPARSVGARTRSGSECEIRGAVTRVS